MLNLQHPENLWIDTPAGLRYGGDQIWYTDNWKKQAGCGPTAAANMMMYLAFRNERLAALYPSLSKQKSEFTKLMEEVWRFVTPGGMGVNTTDMFADGAVRYAASKGVELQAVSLSLPGKCAGASKAQVDDFLQTWLGRDVPVAFLNLSNGSLQNLESWHWVTLMGFDSERCIAAVYDHSRSFSIDMERWLDTTALGGGFVALSGHDV